MTVVVLVVVVTLLAGGRGGADEPRSWQGDWAVDDGLALDLDIEGFQLPSAIAFVPEPGGKPKDPLYFVTELRGAVKVVTNDRSVHTFADKFFVSRPEKALPDIQGETGMAGICLDPRRGYVFVTFAYRADDGVLRNNIVRFESTPRTFTTRAASSVAFTEIFAGYRSVPSHQIGGCQVDGDVLYVSVADGRQTAQAQVRNSVLGKILRMTLDGQPVPDNPFYSDDVANRSAAFVWAYGLRNPFGIHVVDGRVLIADNGHGVDRVLEARRGVNYLWDGSDTSIGTNAAAVITPSVGPVQLDYYRGGSSRLPPRYASSLFVALSAARSAGVMAIRYDPETGVVLAPPRSIVRHIGRGRQYVVGVAVGPDGLYFVPLFADTRGRSAVFKVGLDPQRSHPFHIAETRSPDSLLVQKGCLGCHRLGTQGGVVAPALDRERLRQSVRTRVEASGYALSVEALDRIDAEPFRSYRAARQAVLQASGEAKLQTWVKYRIVEPRFDDAHAQMPNLQVSEAEAEAIARYLVRVPSRADRLRDLIARVVPRQPGRRHIALFFALGLCTGATLLTAFLWASRRFRAGRHSPHAPIGSQGPPERM